MQKTHVFVVALAVAGAICSQAVGQTDPNVELMKKLYTKIGQSVGVGSNNPDTGETFLVLANPGILLDPNLDATTPEGRYRLSRTIDRVLKPSWIYKTTNDLGYDVYSNILNYHEAADVKPTAQQKAIYMDACKVIFDDCQSSQPGTYTVGYNKYVDAKNKLASAAKAAEDYQRTTGSDDLPPDIANALDQATQNLMLLGNRTNIEAAIAKINTYEHIDPNAWWGELFGKFTKNSLTYSGSRYGNYNIYPAYSVWLDKNQTWSKLVLTQSDLERTTNNSSSSVGGGLSGGWGLWSFGADYSHEENRSYFKLDASGLTVGMELMRVVIDRPWMDSSVFQSHAWKWLKASVYDGNYISDGGNAVSGITPAGVMPFVPTGVLLARNVSLSGSWSSDLETTFNSHTSAGASIGWGPFSFGGRTNSTDSSTYKKANAAGNTVSWDAPQIIGFFVDVLPKSPDPNPCYKYPSSVGPLPPQCQQQPFADLFHMMRSPTEDLLDQARDMLNLYKLKARPPKPL